MLLNFSEVRVQRSVFMNYGIILHCNQVDIIRMIITS